MTDINFYPTEITSEFKITTESEFVGISFILASDNDRLSRKESAVTFWVGIHDRTLKINRRQFAETLRTAANALEQMKTSEVK